ncbi:unnamed protein product [Calicophoron daubneyi]|uniref:EGF-like domain-containing protein n=1 Tax=Calicophoron daubneyi TaxID=300641 RepID=A0AAV2TV59_CALDB
MHIFLLAIILLFHSDENQADTHIIIPSLLYVEEKNLMTANTACHLEQIIVNTTVHSSSFLQAYTGNDLKRHQVGDRYETTVHYRSPFILDSRQSSLSATLNFNIQFSPDSQCKQDSPAMVQTYSVFGYKPLVMIGGTDKMVYRPGETVRARFVTTSPRLIADNLPKKKFHINEKGEAILGQLSGLDVEKINKIIYEKIYLTDSHGRNVVVLTNVDSQKAISSLNFVLPPDSVEGQWNITATVANQQEVVHFKVEDYSITTTSRVLVDLYPPDFLSYTSKFTQFSVCATRENGMPFYATVRSHLCVCSEPADYRMKEAVFNSIVHEQVCPKRMWFSDRRPCVKAVGRLSENRCTQFNVSTLSLNLQSKVYSTWNQISILCADIIEEGSDFRTKRCQYGTLVQSKSVKMDLNLPAVYRTGLPLFGHVKLMCGDMCSVSRIPIDLFLTEQPWGCHLAREETHQEPVLSNYHYSTRVVTNGHGYAEVLIPPINTTKPVLVKAIYRPAGSYTPDESFSRRFSTHLVQDYETPVISRKMLKPWIGVTTTVMQLWKHKVTSNLQCPKSFTVSLLANTPLADKNIYIDSLSVGGYVHEILSPDPKRPVLCQDRDDDLGHYKCKKADSDEIDCLPGWTGDNCLRAVCVNGCHYRGGSCVKPNVCVCSEGWKGQACDVCIKRSGCVHGKCLNGDDCICEPDWYGENCDRKEVTFQQVPIGLSWEVKWRLRSGQLVDASSRPAVTKSDNPKLTLYQRTITINTRDIWGPEDTLLIYFYEATGKKSSIVLETLSLEDMPACLKSAPPMQLDKDTSELWFDETYATPGEVLSITVRPKGMPKEELVGQQCFIRLTERSLESFLSPNSITARFSAISGGRRKWQPNYPNHLRAAFSKIGLQLISDELPQLVAPSMDPCHYMIEHTPDAYSGGMNYNQPIEVGKTMRPTRKSKERSGNVKMTNTVELEPWIFEAPLSESKKSLNVQTPLRVPDIITIWKVTAYCTTRTRGMWISNSQLLPVIQPYRVNIATPVQIRLGEVVHQPIILVPNNTQKGCYDFSLRLNLHDSDWTRTEKNGCETCACAGDKRTVLFDLAPRRLGKLKFAVEVSGTRRTPSCTKKSNQKQHSFTGSINRQIFVAPDGIVDEVSATDILHFPDNENTVRKTYPLTLPATIVPGSVDVHIIFTNEIFSPILASFTQPSGSPIGCGEQNMLLIAPNLYLLDYLKSVPSVNPANTADRIRQAKLQIVSGYTEQLNYARTDGSFSTFGNHDSEGSTWLTAFVLRVFAEIYATDPLLPINWDRMLKESFDFLLTRQNPESGCFLEGAGVPHPFILEHASDTRRRNAEMELLTTAFVLTSVLETKVTPENVFFDKLNETVSRGYKCLQHLASTEELGKLSTSTLAQLAYTISLLEPDGGYFKNVYGHLVDRQINEIDADGRSKVHWVALTSSDTTHKNVVASSVETTSYGYLTLAQLDSPEAELFPVVRWLISQPTFRGEFRLTRDMVLSFQALTNFAKRIALASSPNPAFELRGEQDLESVNFRFTGVVTNETVQDQRYLTVPNLKPDTVKQVTWKLTRNSPSVEYVAVHTSFRYNHQDFEKKAQTHLSVDLSVVQGADTRLKPTCTAAQISICVRPTEGTVRMETGMILLEVGMISGWQPIKENMSRDHSLESHRRVEIDGVGTAFFYFYGFTNKEAGKVDRPTKLKRCARLKVSQMTYVENPKPALIKVRDYHEPELVSVATYNLNPCVEAKKSAGIQSANSVTITKHPAQEFYPVCGLMAGKKDMLASRFLKAACNDHDDLLLIHVLSVDEKQPDVRVTRFLGGDDTVTWSSTLDARNTPKCLYSMLKQNAKLILLVPGSMDIHPGDPKFTLQQAENSSLILSASDALPVIDAALVKLKPTSNGGGGVNQAVDAQMNCGLPAKVRSQLGRAVPTVCTGHRQGFGILNLKEEIMGGPKIGFVGRHAGLRRNEVNSARIPSTH